MTPTPESVKVLLESPEYGDRLTGINQLRQLPPSIAFILITPLIKDKNARIRYAAVSQLDPLGKENLGQALELLRDRLHNDPEIDVKAAAADVIGGLQLTSAFEDLKDLYFQTSEWLIHLSIIAALGEFGDPRGFDLLKDAINSDNNLVKTAAISSFGELGDTSALSLLLPLVDDEDWQIRHRLAMALGRLGGEQSQATLEKLAADNIELVAQEAKRYLS